MAGPERLAIFDLGKTNAKMILRDRGQRTDLDARSIPNTVLAGGPYPHFDIPALQNFVLASLAEFARSGPIDAIMVSTHGAGIACMAGDDLALPVLDYEHDGPDACAAAYDAIRRDQARTGSPRMPRGLNLGAQLHWLAHTRPEEMAQVDRLLFWPQYWSHWFSGIAVSEIAYAGCHTDLWDLDAGTYLDLPGLGLDLPALMPPLARSGAALGPLRRDLCDRIGLERAPLVLNGGHDSSLALVPAALDHDGPVTVLSTGTWICGFSLNGGAGSGLSGPGQMVSLDTRGQPVPNMRFMGGQILARLTSASEAAAAVATPERIEGVFDAGTAWLADADGAPVDPATLPRAARTDVISRLLARETVAGLRAIGAAGPVLIDGPFAGNAAYRQVLRDELGAERIRDGAAPGVTGGIDRLLDAPA